MKTPRSPKALTELSPLRNTTRAQTVKDLASEQLRHFSIDPQSAQGRALAGVAEHLYSANLAVHDLWSVTLDTLSRLPQSDPELRKTAWLAATALALQRCREPGYGGGPEALEVLARDIRETFPEGGAFVREFDRERRRCR